MTPETFPPDYAVVGGLALDNVITADGGYHVGKPGGNTLWAALGAAIFDRSVGIVARAGSDYPQHVLEAVAGIGVHIDGILHTGEPHKLRIAYKHLNDGRRLQPVPDADLAALPAAVRAAFTDSTLTAATRRGADPEFADIPQSWLGSVLGWHVPLVSLASHRDIVTRLRAATTATLIADCPNRHEVRDPVDDMAPTIAALDAFLPSSSDFEIIAADADPVQLARTLALAGGGTVVLKRGEAGALVIAPGVGEYVVPAVPVRTVDPTGAGDAFCGAFLVAFAATADPVSAAMHGSVAGSFAAETADPTALRSVSEAERDGRMHYLKQRIVRV